jgi:hypothetical protein
MPPLRRSRCHLAVIALVSLVSSLGSCSWEFHDRVAHAHDKRPIYADAALASAAFVGAVVAVARIVEGTNNCVNDLQGGPARSATPYASSAVPSPRSWSARRCWRSVRCSPRARCTAGAAISLSIASAPARSAVARWSPPTPATAMLQLRPRPSSRASIRPATTSSSLTPARERAWIARAWRVRRSCSIAHARPLTTMTASRSCATCHAARSPKNSAARPAAPDERDRWAGLVVGLLLAASATGRSGRSSHWASSCSRGSTARSGARQGHWQTQRRASRASGRRP